MLHGSVIRLAAALHPDFTAYSMLCCLLAEQDPHMEEAVKAASAPRSGFGLDRRFQCGYDSAKDAEHLLQQTSDRMLCSAICIEYRVLLLKYTVIKCTFHICYSRKI